MGEQGGAKPGDFSQVYEPQMPSSAFASVLSQFTTQTGDVSKADVIANLKKVRTERAAFFLVKKVYEKDLADETELCQAGWLDFLAILRETSHPWAENIQQPIQTQKQNPQTKQQTSEKKKGEEDDSDVYSSVFASSSSGAGTGQPEPNPDDDEERGRGRSWITPTKLTIKLTNTKQTIHQETCKISS
jgi:hypothetical protein